MQEKWPEKLEKTMKIASNIGLHLIHNFFTKNIGKIGKKVLRIGEEMIEYNTCEHSGELSAKTSNS